MCIESQSNTITTLIAVGGTVAGTLIGAVFGYMSIKRQYKLSVQKMRVDRKFEAYEKLIEQIIIAGGTRPLASDAGSPKKHISAVLHDKVVFKNWYLNFQRAWYPKQYLLDPESLKSCQDLYTFLTDLLNKHPNFTTNDPPLKWEKGELFDIHTKFLSLVATTGKHLQSYLSKGIEN